MITSILVIEDNPMDALLIDEAIKYQCATITVTRTLEDGLRYLKKNCPDVVLLDVGLPGYPVPDDVIAAVKAVRDELTAIVVVSGNDDPDVINKAIASECSGWIVKGRWGTLLLEIRAAYDNHRHHLRRQQQNREIRARIDAQAQA